MDYRIEYCWNETEDSLQTEGNPDPLKAAEKCLDAAISFIVSKGASKEHAAKMIIECMANLLSISENKNKPKPVIN